MADAGSGRAGPEGPPAAVLARFAAERVARLGTRPARGPPAGPGALPPPRRAGAVGRGRALAADPRVAMLADHYEEDWTALWWVELRGEAAFLEGAAAEAALDALAERYAPSRSDRPPGPVVAVPPRRWAWWSAG